MAVKYNPNYSFLHKNWADFRFLNLVGGARSGKTYSVYDLLIFMFSKYKNAALEVDCVRDVLPVLKATVLKEFIERLKECGMYSEENHNMSEQRITVNGNYFNYYSVDTEIKARGRKRHILWLNEPNNIKRSIIDQLLIRTTHKVIIDLNPSDPIGSEHWFYDDIQKRDNACNLVTTYKDNPHLTKEIIDEIESYRDRDPEFFKVFGSGERASARIGQIITHAQKWPALPYGNYFYGLDFGKTNDPTALVRCYYDKDFFAEEVIYQTNLTSSEIIKLMKERGVSERSPIYADSAEPLMIREIKQAGFNIIGADKGKGSISGGIDKLKSMNLFITSSSLNIWKEVSWYVWQLDKNGKPTDEPTDLHNHAFDAIRYSLQHLPTTRKRAIFTAGNMIQE